MQNEGVWFGYTKIPEADSTTFQIIKDYPQYGLAIDSKYVYINADKETKENIKKHWSLGRCEYETLFEQIKDNPLYEANILVELMKETNTMEDFYKNERCAL
ncbi:MAG: hypothetical protein LBH96_00710 [Candidatus Peribacteria bacterium]|nr:hypothetical protein [Candidatus Peribacteria bacterium]